MALTMQSVADTGGQRSGVLPKFGNSKKNFSVLFLERPHYFQITTINMCLLGEVKHNIHIQYHGK